jgi:Family of unknown function (DUF6221)
MDGPVTFLAERYAEEWRRARDGELLLDVDVSEWTRGVDARRRMLDRHAECGSGAGYCDDGGHAPLSWGGCPDLGDLLAPYQDHPGYDPSWPRDDA